MLDLGTLQIGVKVDDAQAKQQLNNLGETVDDTGTKTDTLGTKAKAAIKAFVAAYAVGQLIKLGKAAVDAYAQFEQLEGGVNKIFGKEAADTVMKNANNAYRTAGISANKYMEQVTSFSASLIQSMGGNTEAAAKVADMAIKDMSDNANTFGTNMQSIQDTYQGFAKQNYTMLDNLKLGYGGTKTEMERLLADAEKLSGQKYDISNLDDVYEAIHVIQEEMHVTGTTSKEAADTIGGSMGTLKASWENLLTALGGGGNLEKAINNLMKSAGNVVKNLVPVVFKILVNIVKGVVQMIPQLISYITTGITKLTQLMESGASQGFIKTGFKLIGKLIIGIVQALPDLAAALIKLVLALPGYIIGNAKAMVKAGMQLIKSLWDGLKDVWKSIPGWIKQRAKDIKEKFSSISLKKIGKNILQSLKDGFVEKWESLKSWVSEKASWITSKFSNAKASANKGTGHRIGLAEVPYDGYSAILHKGETVLTAAETNQMQKGSSSADIRNAVIEGVKSMIGPLQMGMIAAVSDVDVVLDAREVGRFIRKTRV